MSSIPPGSCACVSESQSLKDLLWLGDSKVPGAQTEVSRACFTPGLPPYLGNNLSVTINSLGFTTEQSGVSDSDVPSASLEMVVSGQEPGGKIRDRSGRRDTGAELVAQDSIHLTKQAHALQPSLGCFLFSEFSMTQRNRVGLSRVREDEDLA